MFDREFRQQVFEPFTPFAFVGHSDFEDRQDIVFDRHTAENRHFLWQVADPEPRTPIHRQGCHVASVDDDFAAFRCHQPRDGVKASGFT